MDMKIKSDVLYFENNLLHAYNFMLYFICNRASNISNKFYTSSCPFFNSFIVTKYCNEIATSIYAVFYLYWGK